MELLLVMDLARNPRCYQSVPRLTTKVDCVALITPKHQERVSVCSHKKAYMSGGWSTLWTFEDHNAPAYWSIDRFAPRTPRSGQGAVRSFKPSLLHTPVHKCRAPECLVGLGKWGGQCGRLQILDDARIGARP